MIELSIKNIKRDTQIYYEELGVNGVVKFEPKGYVEGNTPIEQGMIALAHEGGHNVSGPYHLKSKPSNPIPDFWEDKMRQEIQRLRK